MAFTSLPLYYGSVPGSICAGLRQRWKTLHEDVSEEVPAAGKSKIKSKQQHLFQIAHLVT